MYDFKDFIEEMELVDVPGIGNNSLVSMVKEIQ